MQFCKLKYILYHIYKLHDEKTEPKVEEREKSKFF